MFIGSILVFCSILITKAGGRFGLPALLLPAKEERRFEVELPEEAGEQKEITVTAEILAERGNTLTSFGLPKGVLVIFIKRGDRYIVPNGSVVLQEGDHLLTIASSEIDEE